MVKAIFQNLYGKKRYQRFFHRLLGISLAGLNLVGGGRSIRTSGEMWAIKYVLSKSKKDSVVFDVGAQGGEYSETVLEANPDAKIYAFEPADKAKKELVKQFQENKNVKIIPAALGVKTGMSPLYSSEGVSGVDSLYELSNNDRNTFAKSADIQVYTLDDFCITEKIGVIDLLKLDVEGSEMDILKGAINYISKGNINFIQFEHSGASFKAGYRFADVFDLLNPYYKIYRILQDGLEEIKKPSQTEEFPFAVNYLASKKD
ncbi:MAG: hypothetical protein JWP09_395 [Candidatus Taylorbacteria bacterium]|nr:hypothetical protein [Candidatus Taylorbacteria bacterium]